MFDEMDLSGSESFSPDEAFNILNELEKNRPDEIRKKRTHFRVAVKAALTLQAANSSDMLSYKIQGVTGDISESGMGALFPIPQRVGDVYRLVFNRSELDLPLIFARCVRCRLIREDAFETGFLFFSQIGLPSNLTADHVGER